MTALPPLLTSVYDTRQSLFIEAGATYFYGTFEERSFLAGWQAGVRDVEFVEIREEGLDFCYRTGGGRRYALRHRADLEALVGLPAGAVAYVDITGIGHQVWAPLVRLCLERGIVLRVVYTEPHDYRYSPSPISGGEIFDLSERIEGIFPLPTFVSLIDDEGAGSCFVPLLGFEGARLAYMLEQVQPDHVVPVVGVPGFRMEYPFHTYLGNMTPLLQTHAWRDVRYTNANCAFSLFRLLKDIQRNSGFERMKIAIVGTKPHALGAVLYALKHPAGAELIYDHPKRKVTRTQGSARSLVYYVSEFCADLPVA